MSGRTAKEVPHADARSSEACCPQECGCKTKCRRYAVVLRGALHAVRLRLCRSGLLTQASVIVVPDVPRRVRCGTRLFLDGEENDERPVTGCRAASPAARH